MMKRLLLFGAVFLLAGHAPLAEMITYSYDTAGRLVGADYGFGKTTVYHYDPTGNLLRSANVALVDADNDGMDDAWELFFFNTLDRDGTGDFDGDGMSDLAEHFAGTLPNNHDSLLRMERNVTNTLIHTTVKWQSVSGKTYRVQYKDSLADSGWNDLPGNVTATGPTATRTDVTTPGQPQRFYRVQVLQ